VHSPFVGTMIVVVTSAWQLLPSRSHALCLFDQHIECKFKGVSIVCSVWIVWTVRLTADTNNLAVAT